MHPEQLDDMIRRSDDHVGAEPDENRPEAVVDSPHWEAKLRDDGFVELWFGSGVEWTYGGCFNADDAVMMAHAILSEVETATRKDDDG